MRRQVLVLGVLHDGHGTCEGYTYWHLLKLLEAYRPDLVCLEVGPKRLATGDFRCDSPEKWGITLPWATERGIAVAGVDCDGQDAAERAQRQERAWRQFEQAVDVQATLAELEARVQQTVVEAGGMEDLLGTYELTNRRRTKEVFRRTHDLNEVTLGHYGDGILTGNWVKRNQRMFELTVEAIRNSGAQRAVFVVGGEHKYALDDLFAAQDNLDVLQLADFLTEPLTLTDAERRAFRCGEAPITYPSSLMFIHRKLHGGEPGSYSQTIPEGSTGVDLDGVRERIERGLAECPGDSDLLYYRGLYRYYHGQLVEATQDFEVVAEDRDRKVGLTIPLWELAVLRCGQMLDMMGNRTEALDCYTRLIKEGSGATKYQAKKLLLEPFGAS